MHPTVFLHSLVVFFLLLSHGGAGESYTQERRFKSPHLLDKLLEQNRPQPIAPEGYRCLPCLLRRYLQKNNAAVKDAGAISSTPFRGFPKGRLNLGKSLKGVEFGDRRRPSLLKMDYSSLFGSRTQPRLGWSTHLHHKDLNYKMQQEEEEEEQVADIEENYFEDIPSDLEESYVTNSANEDQNYDLDPVDYRDHVADAHMEICKTRKTWKLLNETRNQLGKKVRVLPRTHEGKSQFVHVYECAQSECERCGGVDRNSRCKMKENYLNLYHEVDGVKKYDYVVVATHCTCELLPDEFHIDGCLHTNGALRK